MSAFTEGIKSVSGLHAGAASIDVMHQWDDFIASMAILNEEVGNEVHAVAKSRQRTRSKKKPWGVWGQTATGLSTTAAFLCAIARQRRVTTTLPPFDGALERGARQPEGITLLACDRRRLWPTRQRPTS